jgi:hypothetical protein
MGGVLADESGVGRRVHSDGRLVEPLNEFDGEHLGFRKVTNVTFHAISEDGSDLVGIDLMGKLVCVFVPEVIPSLNLGKRDALTFGSDALEVEVVHGR